MIPVHQNQKFATTELEWYPYDDEETYDQNLITRLDDLVRLNWVNRQIRYKFNSNGFRSEEFTDNSVVFLGCSITFGIGLTSESIFPTIVADRMGLNCANLAISGSSNDTAFRIAEYWLREIKPVAVVLMSPDKSRLELLTTDVINYRVNSTSLSDKFYQRWIMNEENSRLNQIKNQLAIKSLCQMQGIKFLNFNVETDFCYIDNDFARDLSHPGIAGHIATAEKIINKF